MQDENQCMDNANTHPQPDSGYIECRNFVNCGEYLELTDNDYCQGCTEEREASDLSAITATEYKPAEQDIIAALAGELMSACIRVTDGCIYADCEFITLDDCVSCEVINTKISWSDPVISSVIGLTNDGAAEDLADLIKRVEALGEVSK